MGSSRAFDLGAEVRGARAETEFVATGMDGGGSSERANDGENSCGGDGEGEAERERANNGSVGDGRDRDGRVAEAGGPGPGLAGDETESSRGSRDKGEPRDRRRRRRRPPRRPSRAVRGINRRVPPRRRRRGGAPSPAPSEEEVLRRLGGPDGGTVSGILTARLTTLTACKNMWVKGDTRGVAETLAKSGDQSAVVDVATAALDAPAVAGGHETLTLELAAALTPLMRDLLKSPHASYVDLAFDSREGRAAVHVAFKERAGGDGGCSAGRHRR